MANVPSDIRCEIWGWMHLPVRRLMEDGNYAALDEKQKFEAVKGKCIELWPHEKGFFEDLFAAISRHDLWKEALNCCERALGLS